jgi:Transcriptional regulators of sugar metabolism
MLRAQRMDAIEAYVIEHRHADLDRLCDVFSVSKNTIRRDIDEICQWGKIKKIYGGVCAADKGELQPFHERDAESHDAKRKIAEAAASLVEDGDIIFVDAGTTTKHMAEHLVDRKNLTVLTNNLDFIVAAAPLKNLDIITLSGHLDRTTLSFSGGQAAGILAMYNISKAFMGSPGISVENGATSIYREEYEIKTVAVQRSRLKYLLVDSQKFDMASLLTFAELKDFDALITEGPLPEPYRKYMKAHKREVVVVK